MYSFLFPISLIERSTIHGFPQSSRPIMVAVTGAMAAIDSIYGHQQPVPKTLSAKFGVRTGDLYASVHLIGLCSPYS
ncbi:hypothetical protein BLOT_005932 [Blomia tropicalis]|nr:hypothetical protein BLOT_005932 [Blomia tropicalis]